MNPRAFTQWHRAMAARLAAAVPLEPAPVPEEQKRPFWPDALGSYTPPARPAASVVVTPEMLRAMGGL